METSTIRSALAIQCLPLGFTDRERAWAAVDRAIASIDATGLSYTVGPFETVIEGPLDRLLEAAGAAHKALLESGSPTAATYMKLWSGAEIGTSEEKTDKYRFKGH